MRLFVFLVAWFSALFAHAAEPLRVGMEMSYPPFEMRDEQGKPAGVSVDLANALGEFLGRPVELQNLPFDGLIPALKTGRIDLIISSMTATEERAKSVAFSEPYLKTGLCLLVGAKGSIQSIAEVDQAGRNIAVIKGTTGHLWATDSLKQAKVLVLAKETSGVLEVVQGKADAFIYDQMSTLRNWQKNRETTRAILQPFRTEGWAVALHKDNAELRTKVNAFLADYRAKGGFDQLAEKWLKDQKAEFQKLGLPFYF